MSEAESKKVPVGVSARHIHLSQEHVEVLFGAGAKLTEFKPLSQPGQFAANETVAVFGPKGSFPKVRILGPARKATQLEVSRTDAFSLGLNPPVRESGNIENTPGIRIVGPAGEVTVDQGVIVAARCKCGSRRRMTSISRLPISPKSRWRLKPMDPIDVPSRVRPTAIASTMPCG